jgi:uncharacterized membrane protein
MENCEIMASARARLKGKWGISVAVILLYLVITFVLGAIPYVGWVADLVIGGPLFVGLHVFSLAVVRSRETRVEQLFDGFSSFANGLVAYLLVVIFTMLWTLLLIVPGIIAGFSYSMTFFILADNDRTDGLEAIRKSKAMMKGNRWKLSLLLGRFTGWFLVGIFTLGIGFLWIGPYIMVSLAQFYEDIRGAEHVVQQPELAITPGS